MYFIFIICVVLLLVYSYRSVNNDILNPACILCSFIVIGLLFAFHLYDYWDLKNYGLQTVVVFLIGICSFVLGSLIATTRNMHCKAYHLLKNSKSGIIRTNGICYFVLHSVLVIAFLLFYIYYRSHVSNFSVLLQFS